MTGNESLLERQSVSTAARNSIPATEKLTERRTHRSDCRTSWWWVQQT